MVARYSEITGNIEKHWSLFSMLRDNWGWMMTTLGLTSLSGWLVWLQQVAAQASWHQKALWVTIVALGIVFLLGGIRGFTAVYRKSLDETKAIASGLSRSGQTYANGSIIEGGTHRLVEVFGNDQLRSNLTFRELPNIRPGDCSPL